MEDQSQGWRSRHRRGDATAGNALDCDLCAAKGCQARRTDHGLTLQARSLAQRNGGYPPTCGSGVADLAAAARPSGLPPERARHAAAAESNSSPRFHRVARRLVPVSVTHPRAMTSRRRQAMRAMGPGTLAWRRRALETVKKVVTASDNVRCRHDDLRLFLHVRALMAWAGEGAGGRQHMFTNST